VQPGLAGQRSLSEATADPALALSRMRDCRLRSSHRAQARAGPASLQQRRIPRDSTAQTGGNTGGQPLTRTCGPPSLAPGCTSGRPAAGAAGAAGRWPPAEAGAGPSMERHRRWHQELWRQWAGRQREQERGPAPQTRWWQQPVARGQHGQQVQHAFDCQEGQSPAPLTQLDTGNRWGSRLRAAHGVLMALLCACNRELR
jgi:hypothetical protein